MLKDFILYNSPCFNCNSSTDFYLNIIETISNSNSFFDKNLISHHCNVTADYSEIDLKISYNNSLNLKIFHKTNIFETNDLQHLFKYLSKRKMYFSLHCKKCQIYIKSSDFSLDINTFRAKPISVLSEVIRLYNDNINYTIITNYLDNQSRIIINNDNNKVLDITIAAIPLTKIKNKNFFFNKMKTYILFS